MKHYKIEFERKSFLRRMSYGNIIEANSEFEAKVIFLYICLDEYNFIYNLKNMILSFNINDILKYYYKVELKYTTTIDRGMEPFDFIRHRDDMKYQTSNKINLKIYNIRSILRLYNKHPIKAKLHLYYFNINAKLIPYNPATRMVTFVATDRIFKKIRNMQYWHILRLFKN